MKWYDAQLAGSSHISEQSGQPPTEIPKGQTNQNNFSLSLPSLLIVHHVNLTEFNTLSYSKSRKMSQWMNGITNDNIIIIYLNVPQILSEAFVQVTF